MSELLVKVTASDCRWDTYRGSGKGGQHRNKTDSAVRCTHPPSGAVGQCEEGRSQALNRKTAFERMAKTDIFQKWLLAESKRKMGYDALVSAKVERELLFNTQVQKIDDNGKWVDAPDLQITSLDLTHMAMDERKAR